MYKYVYVYVYVYVYCIFWYVCKKKPKPDSNASMPILSQASLKPLALEQAKRFASMFLGGAMPWDAHGEAYEIITYDPPWSSLVLLVCGWFLALLP